MPQKSREETTRDERQQEVLQVGAASDDAEVEADHLAARAVSSLFGTHRHGPQCGHRAASEADSAVRRAPGSSSGPIGLAGGELDTRSAAEIKQRAGRGQALDEPVRRAFGDALGADVSRARIHHDDASDRLARSMSATAFTVGNDVFFTKGTYDPDSPGGAHLLAHELAHVAQADGGAHRSVIRRAIGFEFETNLYIKKKVKKDLVPLQKMEVIETYPEGFQMEADEHSEYGSAIEFVMRPAVEEHDRAKFEGIMTKMDEVVLQMSKTKRDDSMDPSNPSVPLNKMISIGRKDVYAYPQGGGMNVVPQVTIGVGMSKVPKMLGEAGTGALDKGQARGATALVNDSKTPAAFLGRANQIAELKDRPALVGMICLMAAYLDRGDSKYKSKLNYAKLVSGDMLVRTDFASYFSKLPDDDKKFVLDEGITKTKRGEKLVDLVLKVANLEGTEAEKVFARGIRKSTNPKSEDYDKDLDQPTLNITRADWIFNITRGFDILSGYWNTTAKGDLEGLGKLGNKFDNVGDESKKDAKQGGGSGVIMEMRNMKGSAALAPGKWSEYALSVFDYIVSLNKSGSDKKDDSD